jgi:large subunit ribosomal protein L35Ae
MEAKVISFRRGRHTYKPRHFILQLESIDKKTEAEKMVGKAVVWKSPRGKKIHGKIAGTHGNKGLLRAIFEKGLPGQAINNRIEIE